MSQPKINDSVRLVQDIPEFSLCKGEIGVVRSTWFAPAVSYEVEFHQLGLSNEVRCLLTAEQLVVEEDALSLAAQLNSEAGATAV
jgi:Domain of unknown function (DUF4926)